MGACCTKDSSVYADNNAEESKKLTGKEILDGVCSCFFNKEHINYHTYEPENRDDIFHV